MLNPNFTVLFQSLDKEQSWQWVVQHRIPLFLRSDLYSEYKISKLLASPALTSPASQEHVAPQAQRLHRQFTETSTTYRTVLGSEVGISTKRRAFNLPDISTRGGGIGRSPEPELPRSPRVLVSKSDAELEAKPSRKLERKVRWHRSLSVEPDDMPTYTLATQASSLYYRSSTTSLISSERAELSTKSGMHALWKFLKGKAGEKNLLFWLDAERIKYYKNDTDRQR